jgi:hypothetical protein
MAGWLFHADIAGLRRQLNQGAVVLDEAVSRLSAVDGVGSVPSVQDQQGLDRWLARSKEEVCMRFLTATSANIPLCCTTVVFPSHLVVTDTAGHEVDATCLSLCGLGWLGHTSASGCRRAQGCLPRGSHAAVAAACHRRAVQAACVRGVLVRVHGNGQPWCAASIFRSVCRREPTPVCCCSNDLCISPGRAVWGTMELLRTSFYGVRYSICGGLLRFVDRLM